MSDSTVVVGNEQRKMLEGLGDDILDIVTSQANLPTKVWEVWLSVPYERACACGDDKLASVLHKAGAKGNGLHHAARGGHRVVTSELLQLGASPDAKDEDGNTALHIAARLGRSLIIKTLLIEGADKDEVDTTGRTPLHLAGIAGDVPSVKALLAAGADICLRYQLDKHDVSALDCAARLGHVDVMRLLIERGAMATVQQGSRTALHHAAKHNQVAAIELLVREAANVDAEDAEGWTPLLLASLDDHGPAVETLCSSGADVSVRVKTHFCVEYDDYSALDLAAYYGWTGVMKTLLKHGSDVNALSWRGYSALHKAAEGGEVAAIDVLMEAGARIHGPADSESPLHNAVEGRSVPAIEALVRHGADLEWRGELRLTPLYRAVQMRDLGTIKALLAAGASPNVSGDDDETLLWAAVNNDMYDDRYSDDVTKMLLAHGARVNATTPDGQTALHAAAAMTDGHIVDALVEAGASMDAADNGFTPLHSAGYRCNGDTLTTLMRHGAPINARDNAGHTVLHVVAAQPSYDALKLVNVLLLAGADETIMNDQGKTPASSLPLEPTNVAREQIRALLLRAPQDRANRAWARRRMLFLCTRRIQQESKRSGATKLTRTTKTDGAPSAGPGGACFVNEHDERAFRGMTENLFGLRDGTEVLFRNVIRFL